MIMAKRLVSLLNSSISGKLFELESKEILDFINKYSTRANPDPEDKIIGEETDNQSMLSSRGLSPLSLNLMCQCVLTVTIRNS